MRRITPEAAEASLTEQQLEPSKSPRPPVSASTEPRLDLGTLTRLWLAGIAAYGHKWTSHLGDLPVDDDGKVTIAGALWATGLGRFSRDAVLRAFESHAMTGDPWPPSLPHLRAMCFGIPSLSEVIGEITSKQAHRTPFARKVWEFLDMRGGLSVLTTASQDKAERLVRDAYEQAREFVMRGGALPPESPAIAPPAPRPYVEPPAERVAAYQEQILEALSRPAPIEEPDVTTHGCSAVELAAVEAELLRQRAERDIDRKSAAAGERDDDVTPPEIEQA